MSTIVDIIVWVVLGAYLLMILLVAWRALRGENSIARLVALDLISTMTIAVLVIISIIRDNVFFIDVAIAAAALGYLSTVALARYMADQKVF